MIRPWKTIWFIRLLGEMILRLNDGTQIAGNDLVDLVETVRKTSRILAHVPSRYNQELVEELALARALNPATLRDETTAKAAMDAVIARMNLRATEGEDNWSGYLDEEGDGVVFTQEIRGIKDVYNIDSAFINSVEARALNEVVPVRGEVFVKTSTISRKDDIHDINLPSDLMKLVLSYGRKGLSIQRYKGLGEMNPEQLWETTLDPEARTLLQVKIDHADTADEIFTKLMGDVVEPRRIFIQENALNVSNLDV